MSLDVRRESLSSRAALRLIASLNDEIQARYANPLDSHYFALGEEEVLPGRGAFVVARFGLSAVGCGAARLIDSEAAELKRMFVVPVFRRQGVATAILWFLENEAMILGAARVVLETVTTPPDAVTLYRRSGYREIPKFGPYRNSQISLCMGKTLTTNGPTTEPGCLRGLGT